MLYHRSPATPSVTWKQNQHPQITHSEQGILLTAVCQNPQPSGKFCTIDHRIAPRNHTMWYFGDRMSTATLSVAWKQNQHPQITLREQGIFLHTAGCQNPQPSGKCCTIDHRIAPTNHTMWYFVDCMSTATPFSCLETESTSPDYP